MLSTLVDISTVDLTCCPTKCWILEINSTKNILLTCKVKTFMLSKTVMFTNVFNHVALMLRRNAKKKTKIYIYIYKEDNVDILHIEM